MASVLEQTYTPIEYIVIDGGSTDGSATYIETQNHTLAYWVSEVDRGVYHAMNKGINVAKGEYLLFLNSGDHFYSKDSLCLYKPYLLKDDKKDIIYGNIEVISDKVKIKLYPKRLAFSYFVIETLPHPASLIKKTCFNNFMYDEHLKIVSDWKFFMIGICKRNFSYQYINQVITTFYEDGISSVNPELVEQEREQVLETEFYLKNKLYKFTQKIIINLILI